MERERDALNPVSVEAICCSLAMNGSKETDSVGIELRQTYDLRKLLSKQSQGNHDMKQKPYL
jgi:hypothetical protein